jgi:hypothetical protein
MDRFVDQPPPIRQTVCQPNTRECNGLVAQVSSGAPMLANRISDSKPAKAWACYVFNIFPNEHGASSVADLGLPRHRVQPATECHAGKEQPRARVTSYNGIPGLTTGCQKTFKQDAIVGIFSGWFLSKNGGVVS